MTIDHYNMRPLWSEQTTAESRNSLSEFEKRLANHFCIVEIPGKRGKKVPVLLSPEMKTAIDLSLKTRTMGGISKENPFVFARTGNSLSHMRGHDCIRKCIANVDLQMPENINGTKLRKYIATVSQVLNMTENETDWLARHLGHDIRIHHFPQLQLDEGEEKNDDIEEGEYNEMEPPELEEVVYPSSTKETELQEVENIKRLSRSEKPKTKVIFGKIRELKAWTKEESSSVISFFNSHIKKGMVPGKSPCEKCIEEHPSLAHRKWTDIKFHVKNYLTKIRRKGL
ncbi:hypothetical protein JTB14_006249 [Gonioctena quinquepunctata]|nr:hypothetical protein JTB14_006249 [Gonioctena quinquepunctata]